MNTTEFLDQLDARIRALLAQTPAARGAGRAAA
jgi:hypothetical protein